MIKYQLFAAIALAGLVFDQVSKIYIYHKMALHSSIPVIDGLFSITYVRNPGAAFGIFAQSEWRIPFLTGVTLIALVAICIAVRNISSHQKLPVLALSLIFAGAGGNLIDRVRFGEVVDFLDIYWKQHHWPAFNVADSMICLGVLLYAISSYLEERTRKKSHYCETISVAEHIGGNNDR